ncbi:flagellar export chaperone FliS [Garciella nitratireducens]|uniref:Flagellar protein FliS n=1 Tax=Garciella nitratireducens DSM 15102 TaxID=1121911 RepID=A0A1T4LEL1_9FIRM|nr:flagellar export chaperone FliS [Garciella nitratireducens]RBP46771.1 flagellar protein FliS [Garciella nitratireducens]SJZ53061.1 flagellar protein FliS [Garciella nitratireducens DSM 15102]
MHSNRSIAYQTYQQNQINTASQGKLLLMLYDGALKFLRLSMRSLEEKNFEKTNEYLKKTQDIIRELMATIDFEAGEIAQNLYSLYEFMDRELVQANIKKDMERIKNIQQMMQDLRITWAQVI